MAHDFNKRVRRTERLFKWLALIAFVSLILIWIFALVK